VLALTFASGCKTITGLTEAKDVQLSEQELVLVQQSLTEVKVALVGKLSGARWGTVTRAEVELTLDGKVLKRDERPLAINVAPGGAVPVRLEESARYLEDPATLIALDAAGAPLRVGLQGRLFFEDETKVTSVVPFTWTRELRAPRLPVLSVRESHANREDSQPMEAGFLIAAENPNPFPLRVAALNYELELGGQPITKGTVGKTDVMAASATSVFEVHAAVPEALAGQVTAATPLPFTLRGQLDGELIRRPFELKGELRP
jgi:LEA14-like dessication related protein